MRSSSRSPSASSPESACSSAEASSPAVWKQIGDGRLARGDRALDACPRAPRPRSSGPPRARAARSRAPARRPRRAARGRARSVRGHAPMSARLQPKAPRACGPMPAAASRSRRSPSSNLTLVRKIPQVGTFGRMRNVRADPRALATLQRMPTPVRVAVTGAAGQIGYSLLPRIASGQLLGPDQPVILQLLEVTPALGALEGVAMELDDCAFPLLAGVVRSDDADVAFGDADYALLVGAMPRKQGMERSDLLSANGAIFTAQGAALSRSASKRHQGARGRQPGQHERPDHAQQRAGHRSAPDHGDDAPRPQPRRQPARAAPGRARSRASST